MAAPSIGFRVEVAPPPELASQPASVRQEYWREVLRLALAEKDRELAAGLDRYGMPLRPIAESTRRHRRSAMGPADPSAPPLTPARGLSRTRSLLTGSATADGCRLTWAADPLTQSSWGRVLSMHARGSKRLPVRDVIGLAPMRTEHVKRQAWAWWYSRQARAAPAPAKARKPSLVARIQTGSGVLFRAVFGKRKGVSRVPVQG
jgi:hypothetical protein